MCALQIANQIQPTRPASPVQGTIAAPQVQPTPTQNRGIPQGIGGLLSPNAPLGSLGSTPVANHTVTTKPDGTTTHKVVHMTPEQAQGKKNTPPKQSTQPVQQQPQQHQVIFQNNMHHVPFKAPDGTIKHINAKGGIL